MGGHARRYRPRAPYTGPLMIRFGTSRDCPRLCYGEACRIAPDRRVRGSPWFALSARISPVSVTDVLFIVLHCPSCGPPSFLATGSLQGCLGLFLPPHSRSPISLPLARPIMMTL